MDRAQRGDGKLVLRKFERTRAPIQLVQIPFCAVGATGPLL
jgi:hypothetical protein